MDKNIPYKPLVFSEAFYLATKGGGAFSGTERLERAVYLGLDEKGIITKFAAGRKIL